MLDKKKQLVKALKEEEEREQMKQQYEEMQLEMQRL